MCLVRGEGKREGCFRQTTKHMQRQGGLCVYSECILKTNNLIHLGTVGVKRELQEVRPGDFCRDPVIEGH